MAVSNSGCIQIFGENAQAAYDNIIQAVKIAENEKVKLPVMVNMDGFIISHAVENLQPLSDNEVNEFIGSYQPDRFLLDPEKPITFGPLDLQDYYFEHKRQQVEAMEQALDVILEIGEEFEKLTTRKYGYMDKYMMEDAEVALLGLGSSMGTARVAVDKLREKGKKVGIIALRLFRPFPVTALQKALEKVQILGVMDRADRFYLNGGPLYTDVKSALFDKNQPENILNYIYGLGGRDITVSQIQEIFKDLLKMKNKSGKISKKELITYFGVRK
jgi:pyruvate ferredoxin oxidoreductase alpha subunit